MNISVPYHEAEPLALPFEDMTITRTLIEDGGKFIDPRGYLTQQTVFSTRVLNSSGQYLLTVMPRAYAETQHDIMNGLGYKLGAETDGAIRVAKHLGVIAQEDSPLAVAVTEVCTEGKSLFETYPNDTEAIAGELKVIRSRISSVIGKLPTELLVNNLIEAPLGTNIYHSNGNVTLINPTRFTLPIGAYYAMLRKITGKRAVVA